MKIIKGSQSFGAGVICILNLQKVIILYKVLVELWYLAMVLGKLPVPGRSTNLD